MKAVFGVISLVVVLAIVGLLASRQMKVGAGSAGLAPAAAAAASAAGLSAESVAAYASSASGSSEAEPSKKVQEQVMNDVMKAMKQGADADTKEPQ